MEKPSYILKLEESVLMPLPEKRSVRYFRYASWAIVILMVVGSLFFRTFLFLEMSFAGKILFVTLVINLFVGRTRQEDTLSYMELQFYDDYLVLYRPSRYYSKKVTRKEINKMPYKEISKCTYDKELERIHIYGTVFVKWYQYDKNGNCPVNPTVEKEVKDTLCYIRVKDMKHINFVSEIERHSPISVTVI